MKRVFISMLAFAFCIQANAQKKDLNDVKFALEAFRLALISGNKAELLVLTSPELSYGHSSGIVETQEQFVEKLASGKSDFVSINISNESIAMYKNTAIVRHDLSAETNDGGKPGTVKLKVLLVWAKNNTGWILVARQAVKPPVQN